MVGRNALAGLRISGSAAAACCSARAYAGAVGVAIGSIIDEIMPQLAAFVWNGFAFPASTVLTAGGFRAILRAGGIVIRLIILHIMPCCRDIRA